LSIYIYNWPLSVCRQDRSINNSQAGNGCCTPTELPYLNSTVANLPSLCNSNEAQPSSNCTARYLPSSCGTVEAQPSPNCTARYLPSSCGTAEYQPSLIYTTASLTSLSSTDKSQPSVSCGVSNLPFLSSTCTRAGQPLRSCTSGVIFPSVSCADEINDSFCCTSTSNQVSLNCLEPSSNCAQVSIYHTSHNCTLVRQPLCCSTLSDSSAVQQTSLICESFNKTVSQVQSNWGTVSQTQISCDTVSQTQTSCDIVSQAHNSCATVSQAQKICDIGSQKHKSCAKVSHCDVKPCILDNGEALVQNPDTHTYTDSKLSKLDKFHAVNQPLTTNLPVGFAQNNYATACQSINSHVAGADPSHCTAGKEPPLSKVSSVSCRAATLSFNSCCRENSASKQVAADLLAADWQAARDSWNQAVTDSCAKQLRTSSKESESKGNCTDLMKENIIVQDTEESRLAFDIWAATNLACCTMQGIESKCTEHVQTCTDYNLNTEISTPSPMIRLPPPPGNSASRLLAVAEPPEHLIGREMVPAAVSPNQDAARLFRPALPQLSRPPEGAGLTTTSGSSNGGDSVLTNGNVAAMARPINTLSCSNLM
jgi:hypothetical protein